MHRTSFVVMTALMAAALASPVRAEAPSVLLERGIYLEETTGDLDGAVATYKQVVADPQSPRGVAAQAHYHLALCYVKTGERSEATEQLRTLLRRYDDQAEIALAARRLLDTLVAPDPAALMPPDTLLYIEGGSPGRQVETALNMLEGTPLANPLEAMGAPTGGGAGPGDFMGAFFNPSMVEEFKKVRGWATGVQGFPDPAQGGSVSIGFGGPTRSVTVLYFGDSDALRGLVTMGLMMAGRAGEPIEGMQTVVFNMPGAGGCAYDDSVLIVANPLETLQWCVKQYKGIIEEPTLASANEAFARLDADTRRQSALTCWVDTPRLLTLIEQMMPAGQEPPQFRAGSALVRANGVVSAVARFVLDEKRPFLEAAVYTKEGQPRPAFDLFHTPALSTEGFAAVPPEALGVVAVGVDGSNPAQTGAILGALAGLTGRAMPPALVGDVQQVTVFALPPQNLDAVAVGSTWAALAAQTVGVTISSRDAARTRALVDQALDGAPPEPAPVEGVTRHVLELRPGMQVDCYVGQEGDFVAVGLSAGVVASSLEAVRSGRSAATDGHLQAPLSRLEEGVSKVVVANAGGVLSTVTSMGQASGEMPEELAGTFEQLSEALTDTSIKVQTVEGPASVALRVGAEDLPAMAEVFPHLMVLAQYRPPVPPPTPVAVLRAPGEIAVDGNLDEWQGIAVLPILATTVSRARLCWRDDGLYGAVESFDEQIRPNPAEPWQNDSLQLFVEKNQARSPDHTVHCADVTLWAAPEAGPGPAHVKTYSHVTNVTSEGIGSDEASGITCAWAPTAEGYALEFFMPAEWLQPAQMADGTSIGLAAFLRDGSSTPVAEFAAQTGADTWGRPDKWGAIRLVAEVPGPGEEQAYGRVRRIGVPCGGEIVVDGDLGDWA
ncbi:MAG: hypothetical protein AMK73_07390, partial [Planctomycetes bacterium SM23_32]